jgi:hypothetical protein
LINLVYDEWIYEAKNQKPHMKTITNILQAPVPSIISAKSDGEFTLVRFREQSSSRVITTENVWGKTRSESDLRALFELRDALRQNQATSATFKAELFWEENGRPTQLPNFISHKNSPNLTLGLFDLVEYNGEIQDRVPYKARLVTLENIVFSDYYKKFPDTCAYKMLPYYPVESIQVLGSYYRKFLEDGYEGAVITDSHNDLYKLKPLNEIDAVIVGINVRDKLKRREVTSIKVALMGENGQLIDITDVASGIEHDLRRELFELMKYQTGDTPTQETIRVQPLVVVTIGYQETYPDVSKPTYYYNQLKHSYEKLVDTKLVSLRSPRLMRFRPDKTATPDDIGLEQLPVDQ